MSARKGANDSRRRFLQQAALGLSTLWSLPKMAWASNRRIPVMQSWTEGDASIVVALGDPNWRFQISQGAGSVVQAQAQHVGGPRVLWHLLVRGLSTTAYSKLSIIDSSGRAVEERHLKGLDVNLARPRISIMSCSNYRNLDGQAAIWSKVRAAQTDLILFLGDIVYANSKWSSVVRTPEEPASALARYMETWDKVDLYAMDPMVPVMAVWDDHDYGMNNGDSSHPYRQNMLNIFRSFYPLPAQSPRLVRGPGVSFRWQMFGMDFYMLDGRSFRVHGRTQWGAEQEAWLRQDYMGRQGPAMIANGTSFFAYSRVIESVQGGGGNSFENLRAMVRGTKRPMILASGDIHASHVQRVPADVFGFETMEIVSSAVHSSSAGKLHYRGPEKGQIFYEGGPNFMCLSPSINAINSFESNFVCATPSGFRQGPAFMTRY